MAGVDMAGGGKEGGETAGEDMAGGDMAGGEMAGGGKEGGEMAGEDMEVDEVDDAFERLGDEDIDEGLDVESSMTKWFVSRSGDCDCQYKRSMGISYRHVIAVSTLLNKQGEIRGILGGPAISYWTVAKPSITVAKPTPWAVVASKVIIIYLLIIICDTFTS